MIEEYGRILGALPGTFGALIHELQHWKNEPPPDQNGIWREIIWSIIVLFVGAVAGIFVFLQEDKFAAMYAATWGYVVAWTVRTKEPVGLFARRFLEGLNSGGTGGNE